MSYLTLEEYVLIDYLFEDTNNLNDYIQESKIDFMSQIDNDKLTINCKYCDIKINVKTSKLELFFGNPDKPSIELLGKDFLNLVDLKNDVKNIESLATSGEKPQNMNFTQNIDFLKKLFSKYKNEIQTAIKDVSNISKQDEVKFEWKLSFNECQVWPPKSEGFDDNVKFYLDFSLSVGCILELSKELMTIGTDITPEHAEDIIEGMYGYQTPKVETRAIIFNEDDQVLLVRDFDV